MDSELSRVVDAHPGVVWTALPDGHIDFLSQRWCEYTNLGLGESYGRGWQKVVHPEDLSGLVERWRSILASGRAGEMEARLGASTGNRSCLCGSGKELGRAPFMAFMGGTRQFFDHRTRVGLNPDLSHPGKRFPFSGNGEIRVRGRRASTLTNAVLRPSGCCLISKRNPPSVSRSRRRRRFFQFSRPSWASSTKSSKLVIGPSLSCRRYTRDEGIELGIQCLRRREQLRVVPDRYQ
jgi:hypothetical protein